MINNIFSEDIVCMVEEFTGPNYWKCCFSNKVLPRLNKGWQLVGIDNDGNQCKNCYGYGNGINIGCNNNPEICDSSLEVWMSKVEYADKSYWKWYYFAWVLHGLNEEYIRPKYWTNYFSENILPYLIKK